MPSLLTLPQAAAALQVSARSLRRLVATGALPAVRLGRLVRIDPADLAALIHTAKARPAQPVSGPRLVRTNSGTPSEPAPLKAGTG